MTVAGWKRTEDLLRAEEGDRRETRQRNYARLSRATENFQRRECFCGKPLPERFGMAWCDECLTEFNGTDESMRLFIRRKEVARGVA